MPTQRLQCGVSDSEAIACRLASLQSDEPQGDRLQGGFGSRPLTPIKGQRAHILLFTEQSGPGEHYFESVVGEPDRAGESPAVLANHGDRVAGCKRPRTSR